MSELVLSHYRILDRLGMGGMGVVYLARDERLERNVAIKVLRPDMLATESRSSTREGARFGLAQLGPTEGDATQSATAPLAMAHAASGGNPLASVRRAYTLARAGRESEARETLTYLEAESTRRYVSPHAIAAVLIGLGEYGTAIDWLERAYREHDRALVWMNVHPRLDPLRDDPRFDSIVRRVMAGNET